MAPLSQKKHGGLAVERCLFLMAKGALFEPQHAAMPLHQVKVLTRRQLRMPQQQHASSPFGGAVRCRTLSDGFLCAQHLVGSCHLPQCKASISRPLSHPTFVRTSASLCDVSAQITSHPSPMNSLIWATSSLTRLSLGCPASLVIVASRLFASVKAITGFLG